MNREIWQTFNEEDASSDNEYILYYLENQEAQNALQANDMSTAEKDLMHQDQKCVLEYPWLKKIRPSTH